MNTQKRKVLDQHLMFLVDEADKLSSMLHERLCDNDEPSAGAQSSSSDEQDSDDDEEDTSDSSNEEDMESTGRDVSMDESSKDAAASGKATPSTSEKMMLNEDDYSGLKSKTSEARRRELNNIAQTALEFQPKGYTLETTQVCIRLILCFSQEFLMQVKNENKKPIYQLFILFRHKLDNCWVFVGQNRCAFSFAWFAA